MLFRVKLVLKWGRGRNALVTVAVISIHWFKDAAGFCTSELNDVMSALSVTMLAKRRHLKSTPGIH